ncbi:MAG: tRNA uridine-5-carboxymethylaminomethyl(34) synthesis GTPase MnmE [Candidatus Krumholzibacteriota bacterium]|nr:tRNA uridine-5-carboxymethylaminomethyl(34) synthesis GTPase MnmE [Candidatus Krumholzibacteriota bacterium]
MSNAHDHTVAALSTPAGESGIAVVRLSGPDALEILRKVYRTTGSSPHTGAWEHRRLYHGFLQGAGPDAIDEVVCAVMRGPESYTGEDVAEISCHGNTLLVSRILEALFTAGARPAAPGEFTKRAFLNGKLDLIQAEAVADLIHSRSELQQKVAREQLAGSLSRRIEDLAAEMLDLLATVEANIDFIEEAIETIDYDVAIALTQAHREKLAELLASAPLTRPFREGYRVGIAGPVNAGKSSLFNRLIGENRAIVTEVPGTTRDVIREPVVLEGLLFLLQDTAGLRGTSDRVERIGVTLAEATAEEADVVLFVVDGSAPLSDETKTRIARLDPKKTILVVNKIDLPAVVTPDRLEASVGPILVLPVSAETGDGVAEIARALVRRASEDGLGWIARERVVLNARIASLLEAASEQLDALETGLAMRAPLEILAADAREVLACYESATGKRYSEELLDTIFARFCIGK